MCQSLCPGSRSVPPAPSFSSCRASGAASVRPVWCQPRPWARPSGAASSRPRRTRAGSGRS
eukprot:7021344-Lingulodinium_polyedra.AAC.1